MKGLVPPHPMLAVGRALAWAWLSVAAFGVLGCDRRSHTNAGAGEAPRPLSNRGSQASADPTVDAGPGTESARPEAEVKDDAGRGLVRRPLEASEALVSLSVPGHRDAVVSLPLGATSRRPLVVVAHGNYDRPEWECGVWRGLLENRAFILCPRGKPRDDSPSARDVRFTYASARAHAAEIEAATQALVERWADYVDPKPAVYAGFSLGAIFGVPYVAREGARYPRVVLVEGGHDAFTAARAQTWAAAGGKRVLFACGQPSCLNAAKAPSAALEKAGVPTRVVYGRGVGHGYDGAVAQAIREELAWLFEGDDRY